MAKQIHIKVRRGKDKKETDTNFIKALKKWKRKYNEFGIKEELISRKQFLKPSTIKKIQKNEAKRQHYRNLLEEKERNGQ